MELRRSWGYAALAAIVVVLIVVGSHKPAPPAAADMGTRAPSAPKTDPAVSKPLPRLKLPANPKVVTLGDSWATGYAAAPGQGFLAIVSRHLGWRTTLVPDGSSTGWQYPGPTNVGNYADRLSKMRKDPSVDLLFIQGSTNDDALIADHEGGGTEFNAVVKKTVDIGRKKYPNAKVLVMGPLPPVPAYPGISPDHDDRLHHEGRIERFYFVSPYREHWFGKGVDVSAFIDTSKLNHPNTAGHRELAKRLEADIRKLES